MSLVNPCSLVDTKIKKVVNLAKSASSVNSLNSTVNPDASVKRSTRSSKAKGLTLFLK